MIDRMVRAALLDVSLYEEVEHDAQLTTQAVQVVVLVSFLGGIGGGLKGGLGGVILGIIAGVIGWAVWSYLSYWIGTKIFHGTATYGELLRTIGFADAPAALNLFTFIPIIGGLIGLAVAIWILITGVVAVRQALDFTTGKAIATVAVGWVAMVLIGAIVGIIFGVTSFFL